MAVRATQAFECLPFSNWATCSPWHSAQTLAETEVTTPGFSQALVFFATSPLRWHSAHVIPCAACFDIEKSRRALPVIPIFSVAGDAVAGRLRLGGRGSGRRSQQGRGEPERDGPERSHDALSSPSSNGVRRNATPRIQEGVMTGVIARPVDRSPSEGRDPRQRFGVAGGRRRPLRRHPLLEARARLRQDEDDVPGGDELEILAGDLLDGGGVLREEGDLPLERLVPRVDRRDLGLEGSRLRPLLPHLEEAAVAGEEEDEQEDREDEREADVGERVDVRTLRPGRGSRDGRARRSVARDGEAARAVPPSSRRGPSSGR